MKAKFVVTAAALVASAGMLFSAADASARSWSHGYGGRWASHYGSFNRSPGAYSSSRTYSNRNGYSVTHNYNLNCSGSSCTSSRSSSNNRGQSWGHSTTATGNGNGTANYNYNGTGASGVTGSHSGSCTAGAGCN